MISGPISCHGSTTGMSLAWGREKRDRKRMEVMKEIKDATIRNHRIMSEKDILFIGRVWVMNEILAQS